MPPPCRTRFASPGAAHTAPACPQGGDVPLRDWGQSHRQSRETEPGLGVGRWVAQAVQCVDPLLMGYKGCSGGRGFPTTASN